MHRRPGAEGWSRATEKTEEEALQRAERFLKLGFVVYEIRDPKGLVFMDEAAISKRFKPAPRPGSGPGQKPTATTIMPGERDPAGRLE